MYGLEQVLIVKISILCKMDILEKRGIKIPNSVLVKYSTNEQTDDEVVEFLSRYGKTSKIDVISEPACVFQDAIVEFESGNALVELRKLLPYTYTCLRAGTHQADTDELVVTKADCRVGRRRQRLGPKLP